MRLQAALLLVLAALSGCRTFVMTDKTTRKEVCTPSGCNKLCMKYYFKTLAGVPVWFRGHYGFCH